MQENSSFGSRLARILLYNDTRFYELIVGCTAILFGGGIASTIFEGNILNLAYHILPPFMWGIVFIAAGLLSVYGAVSKSDTPRILGSAVSIALWAFWALALWQIRAVSTVVYMFFAIKMSWVLFRIILDRERPEVKSII